MTQELAAGSRRVHDRPRRQHQMNDERETALRALLEIFLVWEDAHVSFGTAIARVPPELRGVVPRGLPYSLWQLLEHLRRTQRDILDFCRNPDYVEPPFDQYWPPSAAPQNESAWEESVEGCHHDLRELQRLAADNDVDLFQPIPHRTGQTYFRELLLAADHNAYHVGQMVVVRRILGIWPGTSRPTTTGSVEGRSWGPTAGR